jgi:hypothetical protein
MRQMREGSHYEEHDPYSWRNVDHQDEIMLPRSDALEDALLVKLDVRSTLRRLSPVPRVVVALLQRYAAPPDYVGIWPATLESVRDYLQKTFLIYRYRPLSAQAVGKINRRALKQLQKWLGRSWRENAS